MLDVITFKGRPEILAPDESGGTTASHYILPTFAVTYGLVVMVIFFLRLDYSRLQARVRSRYRSFGISV